MSVTDLELAGELRELADHPHLAARQDQLRDLADAVTDPDEAGHWCEVDLFAAFSPDDTILVDGEPAETDVLAEEIGMATRAQRRHRARPRLRADLHHLARPDDGHRRLRRRSRGRWPGRGPAALPGDVAAGLRRQAARVLRVRQHRALHPRGHLLPHLLDRVREHHPEHQGGRLGAGAPRPPRPAPRGADRGEPAYSARSGSPRRNGSGPSSTRRRPTSASSGRRRARCTPSWSRRSP